MPVVFGLRVLVPGIIFLPELFIFVVLTSKVLVLEVFKLRVFILEILVLGILILEVFESKIFILGIILLGILVLVVLVPVSAWRYICNYLES